MFSVLINLKPPYILRSKVVFACGTVERKYLKVQRNLRVAKALLEGGRVES